MAVWDSSWNDPDFTTLLHTAGVTALRYPGGSTSDEYHWGGVDNVFDAALTPAPNNDSYADQAGHGFAALMNVATAIGASPVITVDYGSNTAGTGGGDPQEAAAWVAYSNGQYSINSPSIAQWWIGKAASGFDWSSSPAASNPSWPQLRASAPLATDDGYNFLRANQASPYGVRYWEIGNEVYGNGYYTGSGWEWDLHVPQPNGTTYTHSSAQAFDPNRLGNASLGPQAYGQNASQFIHSMKAVDPTIKVGVVLALPGHWPDGASINGQVVDWNSNVLKQCGDAIDFVIVHSYAQDSGNISAADVLARTALIPQRIAMLRRQIDQYCGANAGNVQIFVTETGSGGNGNPPNNTAVVPALFLADSFGTWLENGVANIDWWEAFINDNLLTLNGTTYTPQPPYYAMEMTTKYAPPGSTMVQAASSQPLLAAYAVERQQGDIPSSYMDIMIVNKDPVNSYKVNVSGFIPGTEAGVETYSGPPGNIVDSTLSYSTLPRPITQSGLTVTVPAYSLVTISTAIWTAQVWQNYIHPQPPAQSQPGSGHGLPRSHV